MLNIDDSFDRITDIQECKKTIDILFNDNEDAKECPFQKFGDGNSYCTFLPADVRYTKCCVHVEPVLEVKDHYKCNFNGIK